MGEWQVVRHYTRLAKRQRRACTSFALSVSRTCVCLVYEDLIKLCFCSFRLELIPLTDCSQYVRA